MPHDTHPFAVMFRDGDNCTTFMSYDDRTLADWLQGVPPQAQVLDAVVDWQDCSGRFNCIGELLAFLRPDDFYEQITFL